MFGVKVTDKESVTMGEEPRGQEALRAENEELRRRVAALEHAEARVKAICSLTTDLLLITDREGRYLEVLPTQSPFVAPTSRGVGKTISEMSSPSVAASS